MRNSPEFLLPWGAGSKDVDVFWFVLLTRGARQSFVGCGVGLGRVKSSSYKFTVQTSCPVALSFFTIPVAFMQPMTFGTV